MFNRGFLTRNFLPNLVTGLLDEVSLLPTADSVFLDSPLSPLGISQALSLQSWVDSCSVEESAFGVQLRSEEVTIVSSNLRRAVSTAAIGLSSRLLRNKQDKIVVHNSLQEITRNMDGISITAARHAPVPSFIEKTIPELEPTVERIYRAGKIDGDLNAGQKSLVGKAIRRFHEFNDFVFNGQSSHTVVVVGHSLWLKEFMRNFLPAEISKDHVVCNKKLVNCGVLAFDLLLLDGTKSAVDPGSLAVVYGGFETGGLGHSKLNRLD